MSLVTEPPRIETERLVLDGHTRSDFEALAAMWRDPQVTRFIAGGAPLAPGEVWQRLLRYRGLWPLLGFGYWAVREKASGRFLGDLGFADFHRDATPQLHGLPEAGWVFAAHAHGRGYASEALAAALDWLAGQGHARCVCFIDAANAPSIRMAGKAGFRPAGPITVGGSGFALFERPLTRDAPAV